MKRKCPDCGREYYEPSAVSRKDSTKLICPSCGLSEALEASGFTEEEKQKIRQLIIGRRA